jgi:uncharacterized protein with PIN domain
MGLIRWLRLKFKRCPICGKKLKFTRLEEQDVPINDIQGAKVSIAREFYFCYGCYWSEEEFLGKCLKGEI